MSMKLLVHDLPETVTDAELLEFFSPIGTVLSLVRLESHDFGGAGYIVEMDSDEAAEKSLELSGHGITLVALSPGPEN
jgi:hypothetical protein